MDVFMFFWAFCTLFLLLPCGIMMWREVFKAFGWLKGAEL